MSELDRPVATSWRTRRSVSVSEAGRARVRCVRIRRSSAGLIIRSMATSRSENVRVYAVQGELYDVVVPAAEPEGDPVRDPELSQHLALVGVAAQVHQPERQRSVAHLRIGVGPHRGRQHDVLDDAPSGVGQADLDCVTGDQPVDQDEHPAGWERAGGGLHRHQPAQVVLLSLAQPDVRHGSSSRRLFDGRPPSTTTPSGPDLRTRREPERGLGSETPSA